MNLSRSCGNEDKYPDQPRGALADLPSLSINESPYRSGDGTISPPVRFLSLISSPDQQYFIINDLVPAQRAGMLQQDTKVPRQKESSGGA